MTGPRRFRPTRHSSLATRNPVVALGIFDGVHRGHQAILRLAVRRARALRTWAVAVTFFPHPAVIVAPWRVPPLLLSLEHRLAAFAACGIARSVVLRFTRALASWTPERFVRRVLVQRLHAREVVVGHDFRFGRNRAGDTRTLRTLGRPYGFRVRVVPPVRLGKVRVSSRVIRRAIARGRLRQARAWLGYPPTVTGRVVKGAGRGKRVGIPTANVSVTAGVLPPTGVYAVRVRWSRAWAPGVANLGWRPTVHGDRGATIPHCRSRGPGDRGATLPHCRSHGSGNRGVAVTARRSHGSGNRGAAPVLEVHVLKGPVPRLRGRPLTVAFVRRLRPERRFPSVKALVAQIHRDQADARRWLDAHAEGIA